MYIKIIFIIICLIAPGPTKKAEEVETNIMKRFYRPVISEKCEQQVSEVTNSSVVIKKHQEAVIYVLISIFWYIIL